MAYEIDFIGVRANVVKEDADAICFRWKNENVGSEGSCFTVGVVDGGYEAHGIAMEEHLSKYYFGDTSRNKVIDFMVVTHPDKDHTTGLKRILESFIVKKIYMNRPWLYVDELYNRVADGRITKASLVRRLHEEYSSVYEIEKLSEKKGIPIFNAFQGTSINGNVRILSPSKQLYLDLLVESEKTPLEEKTDTKLNFAGKVKETILSIFENWDIETLREGETTTAENETSVVLLGLIGNTEGFLLTGDAGTRALTCAMDYLDSIGEDPKKRISFYQIPHHGSRHNISPSLLNRMVGKKGNKTGNTDKLAFVSVAENSDHPRKMVVNAYIRRGVKVYKTQGFCIRHHEGIMPERNWTPIDPLAFADRVEAWDN